jgi:hypothetical protein
MNTDDLGVAVSLQTRVERNTRLSRDVEANGPMKCMHPQKGLDVTFHVEERRTVCGWMHEMGAHLCGRGDAQ